QAASTAAGISELVAWLKAREVGRVGMEATGGYERAGRSALEAAGLEGGGGLGGGGAPADRGAPVRQAEAAAGQDRPSGRPADRGGHRPGGYGESGAGPQAG